MDLLIVGSGPVGATFARVVSERLPQARIVMVDAGPVLTDPPGLNLKNLEDEHELQRARELSQGPPDAARGNAGIPAVEGTITARQGTHLVDPAGGMPAACMSTCVGGMGAHWTCATPRPYGSERDPVHPGGGARRGACRSGAATRDDDARVRRIAAGRRHPGPAGRSLRRRVAGAPKVGILPVAGRETAGSVTWTGVDTIVGELLGGGKLRAPPGDALP